MITAAGLWTCLLIVWRIFDKQGATTRGPSATTSGIEWGIFVALAAAAFLAYSGSRIRAAHRPEPPLPGADGPPVGSSAAATTVVMRRREPPAEAPPRPYPAPPDRPRRRVAPSDLFEPVVPEDPPTMPFGRAKRADADITIRRSAGRPTEDATLPLGEDPTVRLGEDPTVRLGEDDTVPLDG